MGGSRRARVALTPLLAGLLLGLGACHSPTVPQETPSFEPRFRGRTGAPLLFHWPLGRTIAVYVDARGAPGALDLATALRVAAAQWRGAVLYREFDVALASDLAAADVLLRFDEAPPLLLNECPAAAALAGSAGVTSFCPDEDRGIFLPLPRVDGGPSRIKFEVTITSDLGVLADGARLLGIVGHELGHVLGLGGHSLISDDLMYSSPLVHAPTVRDARTLRFVLHQPPDLRP